MAKKSGKGSKGKGTRVKGAKAVSFTDTLRAGDDFELASLDPRSTPGFDGDKAEGEAALAELAPQLAELQELVAMAARDDHEFYNHALT